MKLLQIIISSLLISLYISCFSSEDQKARTTSSEDYKKLDTTVAFSGYWISEKYYNSIKKFRSPKKAQDGALFLEVPERTLQQAVMIFNFHEGGPFLKVLKNKANYELWETQENGLTQMLYSANVVSPNQLKLNDQTFIKIYPPKIQSRYLVLEDILFKGKYTDNKGRNIEFKNNGKIQGWENFTFYDPAIDYFDAGMQVDQVGIGKSHDDLEWYGFKFTDDTLKLYKLKCLQPDTPAGKCLEVENGPLVYKLWRTD